MATKISWCDETINPIIGCSKESEGCRNCYAENMARRLAAMGTEGYQHVISFGGWNGLSALVPSVLKKPYGWKRPWMNLPHLLHEMRVEPSGRSSTAIGRV